MDIGSNPHAFGPKRPPQIVLLLDDEARVLRVNRSLAGSSFASISATEQQLLHLQLHPSCDGKCRFNKLWKKAWASLDNRDSIEWEVDDPELSRVLRLNLSKPPTQSTVTQDRRRRYPLLTITDVTKYRREYESLARKHQALVKLMLKWGAGPLESDVQVDDETGDTGSHLMAGYVEKDRSFARQLILAQEDERKRIASDLHDGIAQSFGVVKYKIESSVARLSDQHPGLDVSVFDDAIEEIKSALEEIRRISNNLAPSILEDFGVSVALEWFSADFSAANRHVPVYCTARIDEGETPDLVKVAIYRVVQEALNNVARHASATRVDVSLEATDKGVSLIVTDNGTGFDPQEVGAAGGRSGLGLRSMRERVEATGGTFHIEATPGKGVVLRAEWANADLDLIRQ